MSKELWEAQRETEIIARMSEEVYLSIPVETRGKMDIKSIDEPNFKPIYEKDKEWKERQKVFIEALKARKEREAQIRINLK